MILLDTNVFSALMQRTPNSEVVEWLDRQPRTDIWTTSPTIFEIQIGLRSMTEGRRRFELTALFDLVLTNVIQQRIAPFDALAAEQAALLSIARKKAGRPNDLVDTMIAAIAISSRATIATRNVKHFDDISCPVVNPFADSV